MKIRARGVLVFLGLVLLSLAVWFGGPYLGFGDRQPLAPEASRLIAIGVLLAWWLLSLLMKRLRSGRAAAKLANAVVAQQAAAPSGASREAAQLRERFEEAVAFLKKNQSGKRSLYELPWYVIIGPPGSGKTTALVNSGLKFPLEQRFGKEALRGVGGTRNCDWWFTDEAVLLDTAGRYTTQDADESADSAGWAEFLNLLTRYRRRRPLNGVIVTLSASDLMTHTPAEREANVAAVRRRLDELNRHLKVRLPVYLWVTKSDLIAGFNEYFDDLDAEARGQVWGMTFAPEKGAKGTAAEDFAPEFDALVERLNARLYGRLEDERDVRRRTAVFGFPQQLAGLKGLIFAFVTEVFAATRFDGRLLLRGVYFTSGTQEGTPIDRLLAAISRGFAVAPGAVSAAGSGRGRAYFIESLLREVMFAEAGIAGINRAREVRLAALQLGVYAAFVLMAAGGVLALSVSDARNQGYLEAVDGALKTYEALPPSAAHEPVGQLVAALDALRNVVAVAGQYRGQLAWTLRWGLFQPGAVGDEAREAYAHELNSRLLPQIAEGFRTRVQAAVTQPDRLYQYLKAYVMLGSPEHLDKQFEKTLATLDWKEELPGQPDTVQSLDDHYDNLVRHRGTLRPLPLDAMLVTQARNTLRETSIPRLMYNQVKLLREDDTSHDVHLDLAVGLGASKVLSRKSGKPLSDPIPGLFTRPVFEEIATTGVDEVAKRFAADDWVMGDASFDRLGGLGMKSQVMDLYANDYIQVWDSVMNDVQVVSFHQLDQAAEALGILGDATASPLKGLLLVLEANTDLTKPPDGAAKKSTIAQAVDVLKKTVESKANIAVGPTPAERITTHFAALDKLVAGPPGAPVPIDRVTAQVAQIAATITGVGTGVGETNPLDALTKSGQGDAVKALKVQAATLPTPIGAMLADVGGTSQTLAVGQARSVLDQRYQDEVVTVCQQIIAGRYPFSAGSRVDLPLADFARVFGVGGLFDAFFKENLAQLVDTTRSPWVWRAGGGGPAGVSTGMLQQFQAVELIRQRYFSPGGQLPEQQFTLSPGDLDAGAARFKLELDGQALEYRHNPVRSLPAKWPGPAPGAAAVTFEDLAGVSSTTAFQGPWAWFRLLEAANLRLETDVRLTALFQGGGHQASVIIEPASIRNPFQSSGVRQFRCGG